MTYDIYLSFHHEDQEYADKFIEIFGGLVNVISPKIKRIENETGEEYIERFIEESGINSSTIIIVLVGIKSYKRKHVDWDISAGLIKKSSLVGICLPMRNDYNLNNVILETCPHRLADNVKSNYASIHKWTEDITKMENILVASQKRSENRVLLNNNRTLMKKDHHFCGAKGCECH